MTLSEFKAWFEGYTDGMDEKRPSEKQWAKIQSKVKEISGTPISYPVFIDRYRDYHHYWQSPVWAGLTGTAYSAGSASMGQGVGNAILQNAQGAPSLLSLEAKTEWDSHAAMYAVGKADAIAA